MGWSIEIGQCGTESVTPVVQQCLPSQDSRLDEAPIESAPSIWDRWRRLGQGRESSWTDHLASLTELKNDYYLIRHAEGVTNCKKQVCTSDECGRDLDHGLTDKGVGEARTTTDEFLRQAGENNVLAKILNGDFVIYTSPYARTEQTAYLLANELWTRFSDRGLFTKRYPSWQAFAKAVIREDDRLRERGGGTFDGGPSGDYPKRIWAADRILCANGASDFFPSGGERIESVQSRTTHLVAELERAEKNRKKLIVFVSHRDTLTGLLTAFRREQACAQSEDPDKLDKQYMLKTGGVVHATLAPKPIY